MKLSVVIAVYNTELYLEKCIQSVLKSPLSENDYEIIVINDGSTDKSQLIVENIMRENANIKLINKKNGGQSTARNVGFQLAKGDYIFCLDSDDYIDGELFSLALNYACENDLDMFPIQFIKVSENNEILLFRDTYRELSSIITGAEFMNRFVISGAMARYFYKTEIIKKNNLKLIEGIYHEDEEFVIRFLTFVKRITYSKTPVYYYLYRKSSTVNNTNFEHRRKLLNDLLLVIDSLDELANNKTQDVLTINGIEKKKQQLIISVIIKMFKDKYSSIEFNEVLSKLEHKGYYPVVTDKLSFKHRIVGEIFNVKNLMKVFFNKMF